jgi:hypothetical protein
MGCRHLATTVIHCWVSYSCQTIGFVGLCTALSGSRMVMVVVVIVAVLCPNYKDLVAETFLRYC